MARNGNTFCIQYSLYCMMSGRRQSNEADGENNSFNVVSDLVEGMNKGSPGKNKNLVWLNKNY